MPYFVVTVEATVVGHPRVHFLSHLLPCLFSMTREEVGCGPLIRVPGRLGQEKFQISTCLSGQWSSVSKSGGFFVFKANGATLSFYPSTETLTEQGTKQEEVSMKLFSLLSRGNSDTDANKQALKEQHVSQEQTDDEDEDDLPNHGDSTNSTNSTESR